MFSNRAVALFMGLSFLLPALGSAQAASIKPAPVASGYNDVIDVRKRRYHRRGAIIGAIIGGAIIGGAIARDRHYHGSRRYHRNRRYRNRYYRNRYYRNHHRYGNRRRLQRGHYYVGTDSYDANGFLNEK